MSGFINLGNSCYMNSILQCIIHTQPVLKIFINSDYKKNINKNKKESVLVEQFLNILFEYSQQRNNNKNNFIKPINFRRCLASLNKDFASLSQQDSHELLVYIINAFHVAMSYRVEITHKGTPKTQNDFYAIDAIKNWNDSFKNEYSDIIDIFYGQYHSQLFCDDRKECKNISNKFEPFCYLPLSVTKKHSNLYELLDDFTSPEILKDDNHWNCNKCEKNKETNKKIYIWETPSILIIQLKKFKNKVNIDFPIDNLDISKYSSKNNKNTKYNLYAICNHSGNMNNGHYYSYCKRGYDWYDFDDENVSKINDISKLNSKDSYLLFYKVA